MDPDGLSEAFCWFQCVQICTNCLLELYFKNSAISGIWMNDATHTLRHAGSLNNQFAIRLSDYIMN